MELMTCVSFLFLAFNVSHLWGFRFFRYFFPSFQKLIVAEWKRWRTGVISVADSKAIGKVVTQEEICVDELNMVVDRLGIAVGQETDHQYHSEENQNWDHNIDVTEIFLDEEPTLEEIEQAFQVFDVNGDGFIDAGELQSVLRRLCMKEESKLEQCRKMVSAFDCNGDGLIDFEEFIVVLQNCFS